jgi:hypothetical protein
MFRKRKIRALVAKLIFKSGLIFESLNYSYVYYKYQN